jgi:hypothetical protein
VQQIFDMRCAGGSCHVGVQNPALLGGGLDLSAAQAAPCLIGKPSSQVSTWQRVQPGAPAQSYLMCKLDPTCSAQVGSPMPIGAMGASLIIPMTQISMAMTTTAAKN